MLKNATITVSLKVIEQCRLAIALGKLDLAIKLLLDCKIEDKKLNEEIILLSGYLQRITMELSAGRIDYEKAEIQFAKIGKALINILDQIEFLLKAQVQIQYS